MVNPVPEEIFIKFLCEAKRATYAAKDGKSEVAPAINGSHQLEFRRGGLFYRDIYYGGNFFVGQETVYHRDTPIWGMSYAGGINEGRDPEDTPGIYDFLGAALRAIPAHAPYRGPESFQQGDFNYINRIVGMVSRFSGVESISFQGSPVYQLHYSGGILKQ